MMTRGDMKDSVLQSSMSVILPPQSDDAVPAYLSAVVRALGGRSDADLARTIGVPSHVIANWRRRRRIAANYEVWFSTTLAEKIGTYNRDLPNVDATAKAAVIHLILQTDGNPLSASRDHIGATGLALGGLLALAQFTLDVLAATGTATDDANTVAGLIRQMMPAFAMADHLRAYR
ncbi:hypothetical protein [Sphingomonas panni]|uniref:hypothetical protein n=1 Tax=Sphingomonas panni TaxID=237612 RepID=UPI001F5BBE03|nr:hypothetical protein [Sphingomonas panni]